MNRYDLVLKVGSLFQSNSVQNNVVSFADLICLLVLQEVVRAYHTTAFSNRYCVSGKHTKLRTTSYDADASLRSYLADVVGLDPYALLYSQSNTHMDKMIVNIVKKGQSKA